MGEQRQVSEMVNRCKGWGWGILTMMSNKGGNDHRPVPRETTARQASLASDQGQRGGPRVRRHIHTTDLWDTHLRGSNLTRHPADIVTLPQREEMLTGSAHPAFTSIQ